jgi:hypothetical protein
MMSTSTERENKQSTGCALVNSQRLIAAVVTGGASEVLRGFFNLPPDQQCRIVAAVATGGASEVLRGFAKLPPEQRRVITALATGGASEVLRGISQLLGGGRR